MNKLILVALFAGCALAAYNVNNAGWAAAPYAAVNRSNTTNTNTTITRDADILDTVAINLLGGSQNLVILGANVTTDAGDNKFVRREITPKFVANGLDTAFNITAPASVFTVLGNNTWAYAAIENSTIYIYQANLAVNATINKTLIEANNTNNTLVGAFAANGIIFAVYRVINGTTPCPTYVKGVYYGTATTTARITVGLNTDAGAPLVVPQFVNIPGTTKLYGLFRNVVVNGTTTNVSICENTFDYSNGNADTPNDLLGGIVNPNTQDRLTVWRSDNAYGAIYYNATSENKTFQIKNGFKAATWATLATQTKDTTLTLTNTFPYLKNLAVFWKTTDNANVDTYTYFLYAPANGTVIANTTQTLATDAAIVLAQPKNGGIYGLVYNSKENPKVIVNLGRVLNATSGNLIQTIAFAVAAIVAALFVF